MNLGQQVYFNFMSSMCKMLMLHTGNKLYAPSLRNHIKKSTYMQNSYNMSKISHLRNESRPASIFPFHVIYVFLTPIHMAYVIAYYPGFILLDSVAHPSEQYATFSQVRGISL